MIAFPNSKINLGLHITAKRGDGFHDLETLFYPIEFNDILELIASKEPHFTISGIPIPGEQIDNLCLKAYNLLRRDFPTLPGVDIFLHKHIPTGAGLGGGSSDGAFTLTLVNDLFDLGLSRQQLIDYAIQLGSDCPFFLVNKPCYASGRGELLEPAEIDLSEYTIVLVHGDVPVSTAWAFAQVTPGPVTKPLRSVLEMPVAAWKTSLVNDFESAVLSRYPHLVQIKQNLYHAGALYASMTGSGSSFFGIFPKNHVGSISFDRNFQIDIIKSSKL